MGSFKLGLITKTCLPRALGLVHSSSAFLHPTSSQENTQIALFTKHPCMSAWVPKSNYQSKSQWRMFLNFMHSSCISLCFPFFRPPTPTQGPNFSKGTFIKRIFQFSSQNNTVEVMASKTIRPQIYLYHYLLTSSLRIKICRCLWIHIRNCYERFSN